MTDHPTTTTTAAAAAAATDTAQRIAENGLRAIRELERVLLFTDLKDDPDATAAIASSTAVANRALEDLQRVTVLPSISTGRYDEYNEHTEEEEKNEFNRDHVVPSSARTTTTTTTTTLALASWSDKWKEWMDRVMASGTQTWKETERKLLFTDLDDLVAKYDAKHGITRPASRDNRQFHSSNSSNILMKPDMTLLLLRIQEQLQHMLRQLETKMTGVQQSIKECERTLFFTDIPDKSSLVADQRHSKQDVVQHFVNSQQVLDELQRKVFFTDCK